MKEKSKLATEAQRTQRKARTRILCCSVFSVPLWLIWFFLPLTAEIVDRIAVVVGKQVVKDSDIDLDIRATAFLNGQQPDFSVASRKQAASRLIDQALIRDQIQAGEYPIAPLSEADGLIASFREDRYPSDAALARALKEYGITPDELRQRLLWQLTVLRFIDARFRPIAAASTTDQQEQGRRVTELLNEWLDQARKDARVVFLEKSLQ